MGSYLLPPARTRTDAQADPVGASVVQQDFRTVFHSQTRQPIGASPLSDVAPKAEQSHGQSTSLRTPDMAEHKNE